MMKLSICLTAAMLMTMPAMAADLPMNYEQFVVTQTPLPAQKVKPVFQGFPDSLSENEGSSPVVIKPPVIVVPPVVVPPIVQEPPTLPPVIEPPVPPVVIEPPHEPEPPVKPPVVELPVKAEPPIKPPHPPKPPHEPKPPVHCFTNC